MLTLTKDTALPSDMATVIAGSTRTYRSSKHHTRLDSNLPVYTEDPLRGYEPVQTLSRGITLCYDHLSNQEVVLKTHSTGSGAGLEELENEAGILDLLQEGRTDRNIVRLRNRIVNSRGETVAIVLEHYAQGDVYSAIESRGRMEGLEAQHVIYEVVKGLAHCDSRGVSHRDLSLENFFICQDGSIVIGDFGLSIQSRYATDRVGKVCIPTKPNMLVPCFFLLFLLVITLSLFLSQDFYAPPEVRFASPRNPYDTKAADVWSLGISIFILLTGAPPISMASEDDPRFRIIRKGRAGLEHLLRAWQMLQFFSEAALDLLSGLLVVDPRRRLTLAQVAKHPFLRSQVVKKGEIKFTSNSSHTPNKSKRRLSIMQSVDPPAVPATIAAVQRQASQHRRLKIP